MRKFLPIAVFGVIFSSVLILHALFDEQTSTFAQSVAKLGVKALEPGKNKKLEENYAQAKWLHENGSEVVPSKSKAKIQIVNFWASWCQPCIEEIPSLMSLKKNFKSDDLEIFAINTDEDDQLKSVAKIKKKLKIANEFTMILDQKSKISESFEINALPVTIIIKNGKIIEYHDGPIDFSALEFQEKMKNWLK